MYCDAATVAYRKQGINPATGKHFKPFSFFRYTSDDDVCRLFSEVPKGFEALLLPCQKCLLCTRRYRMHWVLRCMNELRFYDEASYLTLTVDDAHIDDVFPKRRYSNVSDDCESFDTAKGLGYRDFWSSEWNSLRHKPFQDFMKRLRRQLNYGYHYDRIVDGKPCHFVYRGEPDKPLRYFMCGEYGDKHHRPHYHAIVFGFFPPDAQLLDPRKKLYVSPMLSRKWEFGFHTVARVEPDCISYVAGYVDKKMSDARMQWATNDVAPEYVAMSRGCSKIGTGGLGRKFFDEFYKDLYPMNDDGEFVRDYGIVGHGTRVKIPRFYDELLDLRDPERFAKLMSHREQVAVVRSADFDLVDWLNVSHRKNAVAAARMRQREPEVDD